MVQRKEFRYTKNTNGGSPRKSTKDGWLLGNAINRRGVLRKFIKDGWVLGNTIDLLSSFITLVPLS